MTEGENCYKELRPAGTAKKEVLIPDAPGGLDFVFEFCGTQKAFDTALNYRDGVLKAVVTP